MRKLSLLLVCLFVACLTTMAAKEKGVKGVKHVVLIGLDGWGAYSVPKADMPTVKSLMKDGSYTLESRSILPSSSACNWASMIMGAGPELHGFTTWGSTKPDLPSRVLTHYGLFPSVIGLLRDQKPDAEIGYIYEWGGMAHLCEKAAVNHFVQTKGAGTSKDAADYIKAKKPTFTMVAFDEPDGVGHSKGHDTDEYYAKLKELDGYIAEIVNAVKEAGIYDETIFILTADHGGVDKGHGGKTMKEMQIPFIVCGKNVKTGHQITSSVMQYDTAATIAYIFGLKRPQVWIARPVTEVFK